MKSGNISDLEIDTAKQSLVNDLLEWNDSKISLAKLAYTNFILNGNVKVDDLIDNMKKVELNDVIKVAQKVKPKLIYLLGGEENEG